MTFSRFFPVWNQLTNQQKDIIFSSAVKRTVKRGTVLHNGSADCAGLILVDSGQLRAYILSDEGKEITIYRLFEMDICLFSASCIMQSIQFDIVLEAEKDSHIYIIPSDIYKNLMETSAPLANYTSQIMASRFSDVMWLMEQVMWKSFDKRLAGFLMDESAIENSPHLKLTHEKIANHLGSAREVVSRMLKYFQSEGLVSVTRGEIHILDEKGLRDIIGD